VRGNRAWFSSSSGVRSAAVGRIAVGWSVRLVLFFALWLLFVDTLKVAELWAGVASAAIAATGAMLIARLEGFRFRVPLRWLRLLLRIPGDIVVDFWLLTVVVWRKLRGGGRNLGHMTSVPFPSGDSELERSRRAFAVEVVALAPNTYAIGFDRDRSLLLIHQLVRDDRSLERAAALAELA
jgi:multisubunit Na+/H+ antiporter MnhE subunit